MQPAVHISFSETSTQEFHYFNDQISVTVLGADKDQAPWSFEPAPDSPLNQKTMFALSYYATGSIHILDDRSSIGSPKAEASDLKAIGIRQVTTSYTVLNAHETCAVLTNNTPIILIRFVDSTGEQKTAVAYGSVKNILYRVESGTLCGSCCLICALIGLVPEKNKYLTRVVVLGIEQGHELFPLDEDYLRENKFLEQDGVANDGHVNLREHLTALLVNDGVSTESIFFEEEFRPHTEKDCADTNLWYSSRRGDTGCNLVIINT